jgi:ribulose-phosphate 3-epimerase
MKPATPAVKIAPSILAADFAHLAADVARVEGEAELLHVDCMDGHYVPNLTIGPPVVAALRRHTDLFLDCHLMIDNPGRLIGAFAEAGADGITVHVELGDPRSLLDEIASLGVKRGLAFEPETPYDAVEPYLDAIDLLLVMSVHTGFGGQPFIPEVLDKVRAARKEIDARGLDVEIEIDGGIKVDNAALAAEAGVDILVSGTGIFGAADPAAAARAIRNASS